MKKEKMLEEFEKNVEYLRRNVPPDDIYIFTEQTFMAAMFFLMKWKDLVDLRKECREDKIVAKWVNNIGGFYLTRLEGNDQQLDLNMESIE
jgi:hypothetical protein